MSRGCLALILAEAVLLSLSVSLYASPISGSFSAHLVIAPACPFTNGSSGLHNSDGFCGALDDTFVMFDTDLVLTLSLSSLDISSSTVLTFKGVESQAFTVAGLIGALTFKSTLIFAPSLVEIEFVRSPGSLAIRYCINFSTPGDLTPPFLDCPAPDDLLYFLLEETGVFHPAVAHLLFSSFVDSAGMLDDPLSLRKIITDLGATVAGLTFSVRTLLANLGSISAQDWEAGLVFALEGQTLSGITVRSETWMGARQGLECWSECSPLERHYGGKIVPGFAAQEEKIFIRNLNFAGLTNHFRVEFKFGPSNSALNGLTYMEWNTRYRFDLLGLMLSNTLRFDGNLDPRFDSLLTTLKYGDMFITAIFYVYPASVPVGAGHREMQLAEFITMFDPPGAAIITDDLILCTERFFTISCTAGILQHSIILSSTIGSLAVDLRLILYGLASNFHELWLDTNWKMGLINLKASLVVGADIVEALAFEVAISF